ncbi:hypothetical protein DV738_g3858, partial [Chaetothyriales sp. CBS 135597]
MSDSTRLKNSAQRYDAGVDGPTDSDGLNKLKLTGSAAPGSHSAVFGLTPDGTVYPETSNSTSANAPYGRTQASGPGTGHGSGASAAATTTGVGGGTSGTSSTSGTTHKDLKIRELRNEGRDNTCTSRPETLLVPALVQCPSRDITTQAAHNYRKDKAFISQLGQVLVLVLAPAQVVYTSRDILTQGDTSRACMGSTLPSRLELALVQGQVE